MRYQLNTQDPQCPFSIGSSIDYCPECNNVTEPDVGAGDLCLACCKKKNGAVTVDQWGEITCLCSNVPSYHGFTTCDHEGKRDDTLLSADNAAPIYYLCESCGRIIAESNLAVVAICNNY